MEIAPIIFGSLLTLIHCASDGPWYITDAKKPIRRLSSVKCRNECSTISECKPGYSCFQATSLTKGCCLKALKPNETGCVMDEQCKRACESTHCDRKQKPARCLCDKGYHFLFNKCWKKCPPFAYPKPRVDASGFSRCVPKTDRRTAATYLRRSRRLSKNNYC